jgi:putative heme utilization carrier protein HutX
MSSNVAAPEISSRLREALASEPGGVLEEIARREGASYRDVLDTLPGGQAVGRPGSSFERIWSGLAAWPGEITFIVHTADGVFETRGALPPGSHGRGYFNIHGDSPIGGHIRADRCAAIYFVDRPFFGRRSCSVQFVNGEGAAMFKIFVGRGPDRELDPEQVARFEAMRAGD